MTGTLDLVLLAAWIAGIVYVVRQTRHRPQSTARTGARGRRQRARSGSGGMRERFTPPPRYVPDLTADSRPSTDQLAAAMASLTPALLCTLCVVELKQARADGKPDPEVHPGFVLGEITSDGHESIGVVCEVRHALAPAAPQALTAQALQPEGSLG